MRPDGAKSLGYVLGAAFRMSDMAHIQAGLAKVRERFLAVLPSREASVSRLLQQVELGSTSECSLNDARAALHQIAGTAQTLGFKDLGSAARVAEDAIVEFGDGFASLEHLSGRLRDVLQVMRDARSLD